MAKGRAARAGMTRRAVLVVGGVTLLAGYAQDPARRNAEAARTGAAHPTPAPAPGPGQTPPASPTAAPPRAVSTPSARTRLARKDRVRTRLAGTRPRAAGRGRRGGAGDLPMYHVDDGPKVIALTIDDGPSPVYTPQILQLLDKYQVTATFSMIGLQVDAHPGMAREVAAAGHMIANHTWSHLDLAVLPPMMIADQINRATGAIHTVTGRVPTLFRAPYGAWSPAVLQHCAQTRMTPLDWSVDPRDWSRPGVASIVGNIMRNTKTGSIILEHDGGGNRSQTVAALKIVLPRLLAAGYQFITP
jgi:peptidoglycan/xylan/chitin deacetylase (PgdA/CDA1 family)